MPWGRLPILSLLALVGATGALAEVGGREPPTDMPAVTTEANVSLPRDEEAWAETVSESEVGSWILIGGSVDTLHADALRLAHAGGSVLVNLQGFGSELGEAIEKGGEIQVAGRIERDLGGQVVVDASSVYVENSNTNFFARVRKSSYALNRTLEPLSGERSREIEGIVTGITGSSFLLDTGPERVSVDTGAMSADLTDAEGLVRVRQGSRLSVQGELREAGSGEVPTLRARSVILFQG